MNLKECFEKLVSLYSEIELLNEDIKLVKTDIKDAGFDSSLVAKIAKAKAAEKVGELEASTKALLDQIEALVE